MVAGNNKGVVTLMTLEGEKIGDKKLPKASVTSCSSQRDSPG